MQEPDSLIRTKLHLPFTRRGLVLRPRLQEQIAQGLCGPLTTITAPAGFGKTTLVAASLADCRMPVAWLSLDRDDNREGRFLNYLIAALHGLDEQIGLEAAQLMTGIKPAVPEAVLTSLINDLDSAGGEMVLVLDDYQLISSQAVHEQVAFLLEHCPQTLHLVIASRSDPPLPLARFRARGQMVELRAADLRFTADEAAQFLNDVMSLHLDPGLIAVLERRTEGWVAGLQMAALSMRDRKDMRGFVEGFSGTNRYILDYLLEEILASQSPEIQRFLLYTSILERLSASLCDAITGIREWRLETSRESLFSSLDSQAILEYLERENLFLVPLDDERQWYRYHHLFADLLRARLQQIQPDLTPSLHIRASDWFEQKGLIAEAIQHLFAAREPDRAADLIEHYGTTEWAKGDPSVIQMADNLPPEMLIARPKIGVCQAWLLIIHSEIGKALPLLHNMKQHLAGADPKAGQQWIQTIIASALAFLAPPESFGLAPLPDDQALDEIPADELILRDAAEILYGMALGRRGGTDLAVELSVKWIQRKKAFHRTLAIPTLVPFLSRLYLMQGRLNAAASLVHEYLDPIKEKGYLQVYTSGTMHTDLGEVMYERNCLEEAEQLIQDGLQANQPWQNTMADGHGLSALIRVLLAKGDYFGAVQVLDKFETRWQGLRRPREFDENFRTLRARLLLASGNLQKASQWADEIQQSEDFRLHAEEYRLILARIRLAQKRYAEVEEMLAGRPPFDTAGNRITYQLESSLTLAAAVAGQHRLPEALRLIEACLALAEPEGYIHVFIDCGEPVRELLFAYQRSASPPHKLYAQKILEAFSLPMLERMPTPHEAGLLEPLSGRELEVLQLIALGKTNQEIARQLIVAPGTVKAHTATIYRKLDVTNRTEAVARARQLGILS